MFLLLRALKIKPRNSHLLDVYSQWKPDVGQGLIQRGGNPGIPPHPWKLPSIKLYIVECDTVTLFVYVQGLIQDIFIEGGNSRARHRTHTRGVWGHAPPPENFEILQPLRLFLVVQGSSLRKSWETVLFAGAFWCYFKGKLRLTLPF
jgi:hypothetical protein